MIPSAPCKRPAAPTSANARPMMKAYEAGAVAQIVEPTMTGQSVLVVASESKDILVVEGEDTTGAIEYREEADTKIDIQS